jgi:hypothetical protein
MEKEKIGSLTEKKLLKKRMSKLGRSKEFFLVKKKKYLPSTLCLEGLN